VFRSREREREREREASGAGEGRGENEVSFVSSCLVFAVGTLSKKQSICLLFSRLDAKLPGEPD